MFRVRDVQRFLDTRTQEFVARRLKDEEAAGDWDKVCKELAVEINRGLSGGDFDIEDYKFVVVATALEANSGQQMCLSQAALWDASSDSSLSSVFTTEAGTTFRLYVHFARMLDRDED